MQNTRVKGKSLKVAREKKIHCLPKSNDSLSSLFSIETMEVKVQVDNLFNVLTENLFGNLGSRILYPVEIFFKNNSKNK